MTNAPAEPAGSAMRTDARRNYDELLAAARATFTEQGTDASLREVACRAWRGIGTLYRHFPTRRALLGQSFDRLCNPGYGAAGCAGPRDALLAWLRGLAATSTRYEGLPASVMDACMTRARARTARTRGSVLPRPIF